MEKINTIREDKVTAAVFGSKSVKEYMTFANACFTAVLSPETILEKVAAVLSNPEFLHSEDQLGWVMAKIEAIITSHVSESVKNPMTRVRMAFDLAALANLSVGDIIKDDKNDD